MAHFVKRHVTYADIPETPEDIIGFIAETEQSAQNICVQIEAWERGESPQRDAGWRKNAGTALMALRKIGAAARRELLRKTVEADAARWRSDMEDEVKRLTTQNTHLADKLAKEKRKRIHLTQRGDHEMKAVKAFVKTEHPELLDAFYAVCSAATRAYDAEAKQAATA